MQDVKLSRRLAGCTRKRLGEIDFSKVEDGRQGKVKWPLSQILKFVVVGIMAGQKGLAEIEEIFSEYPNSCDAYWVLTDVSQIRPCETH